MLCSIIFSQLQQKNVPSYSSILVLDENTAIARQTQHSIVTTSLRNLENWELVGNYPIFRNSYLSDEQLLGNVIWQLTYLGFEQETYCPWLCFGTNYNTDDLSNHETFIFLVKNKLGDKIIY